jgi:hypothetical protein
MLYNISKFFLIVSHYGEILLEFSFNQYIY